MTENDRYIIETLNQIKARCEEEENMGEVAALIAAKHAIEREMARLDIADGKMVIADKADMDELEAYRTAWEEIQNTEHSDETTFLAFDEACEIIEKHLKEARHDRGQ